MVPFPNEATGLTALVIDPYSVSFQLCFCGSNGGVEDLGCGEGI